MYIFTFLIECLAVAAPVAAEKPKYPVVIPIAPPEGANVWFTTETLSIFISITQLLGLAVLTCPVTSTCL